MTKQEIPKNKSMVITKQIKSKNNYRCRLHQEKLELK